MRISNYWFLSLMAIVFLFARNGIAETDLLNLSAYEEGDSPPYGENVVVAQSEKTGVKWITGIKTDINVSGQLKFSVNLSGNFEVFFEEDFWIELLLIADEYKIRINGRDLYAGNEYAGGDQSNVSSFEKRAWRLSVKNNVAKLYANDVFSQKITLKPDLTYTQLIIRGIGDFEKIYALKNSGSSGSTQPSNNSSDFESGLQAGIQQCLSNPASCGIALNCDSNSGGAYASYNPANGEVYIPFINVPGPFGDPQVYEIYLIQQPSTFTFDLDWNRINLR
ncbi:MAG: hypothetical protein HC877_01045 [Thioploca sp.]|nr:hypothetical protein [Thioploca sp.]